MNLTMDGRENTKVEVNDSLRGKGIIIQKMGKKIWHCKISLMQVDREMGHNSSNHKIEVRELFGWSVGRPKIYNA